MKKAYVISGLLLASVMIYNCSVSKHAKQTQATNPYPARIFDSMPSFDYLDPAAALKTFNLPPGYHLELVASEPMIKEPVAIAWDGNAKMYVAEMLTYMLDADAKGEQVNVSRISLLEDTNNDGKMDKSTIFIDSLLLPRMILCVNHELLVNETNTITINAYKDTDGDGKADQKRTVFQKQDYRLLDANMEHQRSGLDWNLDNYIYLTYDPVRFRYRNGMLEADSLYSGPGGQWGVTHDNYGRLFLTSAGGESPLVRVQINPSYGALDMPDQVSNEFQQVWPIIATPDVQGGLMRLRADSTLNHFTGACGQSIYRGNTLPQDLSGDYIICEPVARLIRRAKVINLKGKIIVQNAYYRQEFIASTDLNFRPVNSYTGPDGNLYIVDMHRGIIQQGNWTRPGSFLRKKIDAMGMAKNTGHGRIYRLVYDGYTQSEKPHMLDEPATKLVTYLDHKNGWWRDNAQKQIVLLGDRSVVPILKQIIQGEQATLAAKPSHLARLHALWTLDGLDAMDRAILYTALKDEHPQIRKAAVILSEPYLKKEDDEVIAKLAGLKNDPSYDVRLQLFLSTYSNKLAKSAPLAAELLAANTSNEMFPATQKAMDRNIDIRSYGNRLGNLPENERKSIIAGSGIFNSLCVTCHGAGGKGLAVAGSNSLAAPVLTDSKRMNADKAILAKIILHGLQGPIEGKEYPSVMPALGANSDEWVASVVNYIRYEFGNAGRRFRRPGDTLSPFISIPEVTMVRNQYAARTALWTLEELETGNPAAAVTRPVADTLSNKIVAVPPKKISTAAAKKPVAKTTSLVKKTDYAAVEPLLQKYTCLACHQAVNKLIGPPYREVAAKKYTVAQIIQLIQKPNPANWPGYETKMPPMAHVPVSDLTQIAQWIKSLEKAK
ncbi:cytochrome C [Paraflavitalea soli]|uniref:Cytochrome C n=1 Tax=Paraflavitalea soli TaxID=2315862 RepID=A0A3B7MVS1_9BACT|nr:c-type cytochrome [Paraflavitalea soli]AXY78574.1 cytochrome C [Paraflavitalea soli]